jgi:hypothetical protein
VEERVGARAAEQKEGNVRCEAGWKLEMKKERETDGFPRDHR